MNKYQSIFGTVFLSSIELYDYAIAKTDADDCLWLMPEIIAKKR